MNYFQKLERIEFLLGGWIRERYPCSWALCFDYCERLVLYKESGRGLEVTNAGRSNFSGERRWFKLRHLIKSGIYHRLRKKNPTEKTTHLVSPYLFLRFPHLAERIYESYNMGMLVTKTSAHIARSSGFKTFIKIDSIIYTIKIEKFLDSVNQNILCAVSSGRPVSRKKLEELFNKLESELVAAVEKLAGILQTYQAVQYVCPYSVRYEEILTCLACHSVGIPSKEICHGLNTHTLLTSDSIVPTNTDLLYVWSQQFYESLSAFERIGDMKRIRIGGYPKFDIRLIEVLQNRFPQKKIILYFSQNPYDIGESTDHRLTSEFLEKEGNFRKKVFSELKKIMDATDYRIRIRYHPGENGKNDGSDRNNERVLLPKLGFEISKNSFDQDLFESEVCIGINTTCLYESYVIGKKTFQLRFDGTGATNYYEDIPIIGIHEMYEKLGEGGHKNSPRKGLLLDLGWFMQDGINGKAVHQDFFIHRPNEEVRF